jgi:lysophospholipid acyltransferase
MLDPLFRFLAKALSTPEDYVKVRQTPPTTICPRPGRPRPRAGLLVPPFAPFLRRLTPSSRSSCDGQLVFCLLAAYPLSSLYVKLPTDGTRHYYSILVATFFLVGVLKLWGGFLQLLISIVGTYLIVVFNRTERMPWLVFAFTMGHLTVNHVYRTLYEISPDVIEITGSQMVLVMKLSSFAWNVYDGRRDINVRLPP